MLLGLVDERGFAGENLVFQHSINYVRNNPSTQYRCRPEAKGLETSSQSLQLTL